MGRTQVSSMAYFSQFLEIFGDATSRKLFPELVLLLPDQAKREELARVYEAFERSQPLGALGTPSHGAPSARIGVFKGSGAKRAGWAMN